MSASSESTVILPADLHGRPAGRLVQVAAGFRSTVLLEYAGRTVDPKGILSVIGLGARAGTALVIRAEGPDAEQATAELTRLLSAID